jgi:flagellar P-ring protein precursor FlgI
VEDLTVETDLPNRIVINERTGTVVLGQDIVIHPVSVLHGNLTVHIETELEASQPNPMSNGKTVVIPKTTVNAREAAAKHLSLKPGTTVDGLVKQLTGAGSTPRDVIAVLQAMRAAGALDADLEVI